MENTIKEIDERHNAMKDLQGGIADLREVFVEVSSMLEVTGLEEIEDKVSKAKHDTLTGTKALVEARQQQRGVQRKRTVAIIIVAIVVAAVLVMFLVFGLKMSSGG